MPEPDFLSPPVKKKRLPRAPGPKINPPRGPGEPRAAPAGRLIKNDKKGPRGQHMLIQRFATVVVHRPRRLKPNPALGGLGPGWDESIT